ncbi:hypothetical protein C1646_767877 [Rhizophagus diaphanus]|nr:hypothetical protein C1646_767877 [Rhizophagus diaphanus] [Rhizophagus sp. MUCL 43196]
MPKLNRDVFYMVLHELQDDKKALYSCLLVNKTWSEIIIPILWKDPWKYLKKGNEKSLLKVITTNLLINPTYNIIKNSYQKPLFDYISYCRHLNLYEIRRIINTINEDSEMIIFKDEILGIFINENTKYTHLYIPYQFDNQIHLIPGAKRCFSELKFLRCNTSINDNVLSGLTEICKSIKELELFINVHNNNYGIVKLIETQKNLFDIRFITYSQNLDGTFCNILENSLNKHANTIQYFKMTTPPTTNILSSLINLKELELNGNKNCNLEDLGNLFLPFLRILRVSNIQVEYLTNLIKNTNGYLIEIKIDNINHDDNNNRKIIKAIYQNCPKLKYLKLLLKNSNIFELEKLLIKCQNLNGLYILTDYYIDTIFYWNDLFEILTTSSPKNLFKFKFNINSSKPIKLESLKLFFDNWKGRNPMLLQLSNSYYCINNGDMKKYIDLIKKYKVEGIVKKYNNDWYGRTYKDFEWF